MSLAEIAYSGWSFASLTLLRMVEEKPQLLVVFVVTAAIVVAVLEEEHMSFLDQQHSGKKGQDVVVVEDLSISVCEGNLSFSWTPLRTIALFLALNCWELEAIFSIKFLASVGVISPRAPPLAASIILLSMLLSPL